MSIILLTDLCTWESFAGYYEWNGQYLSQLPGPSYLSWNFLSDFWPGIWMWFSIKRGPITFEHWRNRVWMLTETNLFVYARRTNSFTGMIFHFFFLSKHDFLIFSFSVFKFEYSFSANSNLIHKSYPFFGLIYESIICFVFL